MQFIETVRRTWSYQTASQVVILFWAVSSWQLKLFSFKENECISPPRFQVKGLRMTRHYLKSDTYNPIPCDTSNDLQTDVSEMCFPVAKIGMGRGDHSQQDNLAIKLSFLCNGYHSPPPTSPRSTILLLLFRINQIEKEKKTFHGKLLKSVVTDTSSFFFYTGKIE